MTCGQPFNEERGFGHNLDPLAVSHSDFPWAELSEKLGEVSEPLAPGDRADLASALRAILHFLLCDGKQASRLTERIGRRCVALAWTIDPSLFDGTPSLTALAKSLDLFAPQIAIHSGDASRRFGIRNRAQAHASGMFRPAADAAESSGANRN